MPRGGKREGSGAKGKWKHGKTTSIRVPITLVDQILGIAHKMDQGLSISESSIFNTIDLTNVSIISVRGQRGVAIADLVKAGYEIKPLALAKSVRNELVLR